ncbi:15345_t:CDS:2 [Cetraspora pellucida]|uniref:15345_t:CDS:1 n=1 Tax=Cetraspora pellucida TaxID=1433469 RepID=A0A9N9I8U0_9GLOM|nr:15345_t:CDS:2 [Cetraspora pellucida]
MENEVRKFERECDKQRVGFLVSNVYISDEAIKRIENNDKMYLCHENEIVDVIKNVEKHTHNINELIEEIEFYNELQKEIIKFKDFDKPVKTDKEKKTKGKVFEYFLYELATH